MRVRISGELVASEPGRLELALGPEVFEVLVPPVVSEELAGRVGESITLHTREVYESQGQGSSFVPRVLGFMTLDERTLFELLTTVKGFGPRKALRSMAAPASRFARAIAEGDSAFLKGLPEIGKRTAETMILDLKDKVGVLALDLEDAGSAPAAAPTPPASTGVEQAVSALVQLGEQASSAEALVARAVAGDPALAQGSADAVLAAALAVRS